MDVHPLQAYPEKQTPPLTRIALAERLGVSPGTITRWESGQRQPEAEMLARIAECTGIAPRILRPDLAALMGLE